MAKTKPTKAGADKPKHSGRRGDPISLAPLTADQALAAALRVNPAELKRLEEEEAKAKAGKKRGKRK